MNVKTLQIVATATFAFAAQSVSADDLFQRLDTNKDGFVTKDEVTEQQSRLFERLLRTSDKNDDGKIDATELSEGTTAKPPTADFLGNAGNRSQQRNTTSPQQVIARFDKDGDNQLSKDEAPEQMKQNFDRMDGNSDGKVDGTEIRRAFAMKAAMETGQRQTPVQKMSPQVLAQAFARRDANRDGLVNLNEVPQERKADFTKLLKRLGKSENDGITKDEFISALSSLQSVSGKRPSGKTPPVGNQPSGTAAELLKRIMQQDADGDGKISLAEAPERLKRGFKFADRNADGYLTEEELAAMLKRFQANRRTQN